jgi:hypothetical protein
MYARAAGGTSRSVPDADPPAGTTTRKVTAATVEETRRMGRSINGPRSIVSLVLVGKRG